MLPPNRLRWSSLAAGIERAGYEPGIDAASPSTSLRAQFLDPATGDYHLAAEDRRVTAAELVAELSSWAEKLPILSIEDVLAEDDCDGWVDATREPAGISCSATT